MLLTKSTTFIIGPVATLLGYIMNAIFNFCSLFGLQNIGLCIILFTVIIYVLMMPLTIKQQKFSKLQTRMNPELQRIQDKYKGKQDQASMLKMNEETKAIYKKYGVSPSGSCVQLIIQFPILFALYRVIWNVPAYVDGVKNAMMGLVNELLAYEGAQEILTGFASVNVNFEKLGFNANSIVDALYMLKPADWTSLSEKLPSMAGTIASTQASMDKMNYFLGLNISDSPMNVMQSAFNDGNWLLVIGAVMIPLLAGLTQWLNTKLMPTTEDQNTNKKQEESTMASSMKMMNNIMPVMSAVFCLTLSTGIGIYWIAGSVIRSIIQVVTNKHIDKMDIEEMIEKNLAKENAKRAKRGEQPLKFTAQDKAAIVAQKQDQDPEKKQKKEADRQKKIQESTDYYKKYDDAKPGSIASKARMVERYNEKNSKKK